jgi:hypothetical protein
MGVVRLPVVPPRDQMTESSGLRKVFGQGRAAVMPLRVVAADDTNRSAYCAACATPIEFGAVMRGLDAYCSVECSLGGGHPA